MLILTSEDVKPCFIKQLSSDLLMGVKYGNWFFYFEQFLNLDLETVKVKYQKWSEQAEKNGELRAILNKDSGIYLCISSNQLELINPSEALTNLTEKMKNCNKLEKTLYHRSWRRSRKCFQSQTAITWMTQYLNISRIEATKLGQKCLEKQLISHILENNIFQDEEKQFYFFNDVAVSH